MSSALTIQTSLRKRFVQALKLNRILNFFYDKISITKPILSLDMINIDENPAVGINSYTTPIYSTEIYWYLIAYA